MSFYLPCFCLKRPRTAEMKALTHTCTDIQYTHIICSASSLTCGSRLLCQSLMINSPGAHHGLGFNIPLDLRKCKMQLCKGQIEQSQTSSPVLLHSNSKIKPFVLMCWPVCVCACMCICVCVCFGMSSAACHLSWGLHLMATPLPDSDIAF